MAMTPVPAHKHQPPASRINRTPIFVLGYIPRRTSRALPVPVLLFPLDAQLFERALEVFVEEHLVGLLIARLFLAYGWASGV